MSKPKTKPIAAARPVLPVYINRQTAELCACGVERTEEDPELAELPLVEPFQTLRICRNCGAVHCTKKKADAPSPPAEEVKTDAD